MSALELPSAPRTPAARLRWAVADSLTVTARNLAHIRQVPDKLLGVTLMPVMFVLLFAEVFGSAISVPGGGNYREYLMPGIFAQTMAFACGTTAVGVANDMTKGIIDRFRSLPMARSAVLVGRTVADLIETLLGLVVMVVCGMLVGWGMHRGILLTLAGFGLLLLFAFAMNWVGTVAGLMVRTPEAANAVIFTALFPMTFVANTFVPTQGMPVWLRTLADWNPLSATVAACRHLFGNPGGAPAHAVWPLQHPIVASLGWSLLILAMAVPVAVRHYHTATSR